MEHWTVRKMMVDAHRQDMERVAREAQLAKEATEGQPGLLKRLILAITAHHEAPAPLPASPQDAYAITTPPAE